MNYVGLDAHLRRSTICVLDENGKKLFDRHIKGTTDKVMEELRKVKQELVGEMAVCFEASCGYGYLHDQLRQVTKRVVVAHPGQLRLIYRSKKKSDRVDAHKLAALLFLGQVPPVYVPPPDVRAWRGMVEHRGRLVEKRTRVKNEIRSLLRGEGIVLPKKTWSKAGRAALAELPLENSILEFRLTTLLAELESYMAQIAAADRVLAAEARQRPAVDLLMTIPGVGKRTAECLVAYIDDPNRFPSAKQAASYFGLIPCLDSSAGKDRLGHITKQGPGSARRLLTEAAWISIRRSPTVRDYYERVMKGDPDRKKIAVIATAHYLLRVSLSLLKNGECWMESAERAA